MKTIRIKRAFEAAAPEDGTRILVDRLWPRGLKRDHARIDLWLKEIAPSTALRSWFGHRADHWDEFARRYEAELAAQPEPLRQLRQAISDGPCTLLYAARDTEHNNAVALAKFLRSQR